MPRRRVNVGGSRCCCTARALEPALCGATIDAASRRSIIAGAYPAPP
jgi:hypothetical protein